MTYFVDMSRWNATQADRTEADRKMIDAYRADIEIMRINAQRMQIKAKRMAEAARFAQIRIDASRALMAGKEAAQ